MGKKNPLLMCFNETSLFGGEIHSLGNSLGSTSRCDGGQKDFNHKPARLLFNVTCRLKEGKLQTFGFTFLKY